MDTFLTGGILTSIFFSALFSGIEIAFIRTDKLHIALQGKQGGLSARILTKFSNNPSNFIATTLIGNNLTLVVYGIFMSMLLDPWLVSVLPQSLNNDIIVLLLQTIISTIIVLFTAEYVPKSIFLTNPYRFLSVLSVPILLIYYVLSPVVYVIVAGSKFLLKSVLRLDYSDDKPVYGLTDLNNYLKIIMEGDKEENDQDVDTKYFNNALDFKTVKVRECMIPRTEIKAVDVNDTIDNLRDQFVATGHSKIIVYNDSIDDVIGYCHSLELFKKPQDVASILTKIIIAPETMAANELMVQLITDRKSIALVVDEYGGTSGIVTLEDIIEEIFGEIRDEHDDDDLVELKINDSEFIFSARQEVDYINESQSLNLPTGEYDTLGGLILTINENLPELGEVILIPGYSFEIMLMEEARIEKIKLRVLDQE
ncbi:hemolysin family protein [Reichenbachiella agariperforans]|uniref:Hemolysin, contains CBS domains n=1 Tax=Reichenbachiella agariperforans TaxID=156994 RepID=A0A1M6TN19_REIAG|nr:hemolysin family protein [Reichenbachiella agariperforans]MBU2915504.1 hemolysin family protein [Reichenbachiella agariperforans]SHK58347.1 Hemolysin, contains CBS domains [Reichenbachiella agariperforans]